MTAGSDVETQHYRFTDTISYPLASEETITGLEGSLDHTTKSKYKPKARLQVQEKDALPPSQYSTSNDFNPNPWPDAPVALSRALTVKRAFMALWDAVLTLTPLTFIGMPHLNLMVTWKPRVFHREIDLLRIVIAFCALSLDGQAASHFGDNILEAEKLGPTVFPVVFAAVVGRLMTTLARWRAEKGSKLGLLEQLNGSQSLFTALERAFLIRRWNWVAILIIILWALSPLGGQSALRLLEIKPSTFADTAALRYLNTNMTFTDDLAGASNLNPVLTQVQALIQGSLLGSSPAVRKSPRDIWANVKIPMIETLPAYQSDSPENAWLPVNVTQSSNVNYSSLVGIVVAGLPTDKEVESSYFLVESSYMRLTCSEWHHVTGEDPTQALYDQIGPLAMHTNSSQLTNAPGVGDKYQNVRTDWVLDMQQSDATNPNPNLLFANTREPTQDNMNTGGLWTNCSVGTSHVQSNVTCEGSSCAVSHMRRSRTDPRPWSVPLFDVTRGGIRSLNSLTLNLPYMGSMTTASYFSRNSITTYLADSDAVILHNTATESNINLPGSRNVISLGAVPPAEFSLRLSQIWNSYLQLLWASSFISGGAPTDLAAYGNQTLPWTAGMDANTNVATNGQPPFPNNVSTAYVTREGPKVYAASRVWIALLLTVSFLMQGCAIMATVLKYSCRIPHILGHVSSLTRDNPHVKLPPGGTTLDGLERARLLKDMYVQVGDVKEDDEIGHIALKGRISHGIGKDHTRVYF